jgi:dihydroflavonol-4-reductase
MTGSSNGKAAPRRRFWVGGATGFLGSHLVRLLSARGDEVTGVSRGGGHVDDVEVRSVDVLDADAVERSANGSDGAFLVTGKVSRGQDDAEELHRLHVLGTRTALAGLARAGVKRVVVASTSGTVAVSADSDAIANESSPTPLELIARWPYYRTKLYGEREALEASRPGFEVVIVNPSLLLGPGDLRESSTGDVRRFLDRAIPATPSGGVAFVDVRDAAEGLLLAFERGRAGERYILNAKNLTVSAFFRHLSRISGVPAPAFGLPSSRVVALGISRMYLRAVRAIGGEPPIDEASIELSQYFWYCDASKAELELGWSARDPGETLRDTISDLTARGVVYPRVSAVRRA